MLSRSQYLTHFEKNSKREKRTLKKIKVRHFFLKKNNSVAHILSRVRDIYHWDAGYNFYALTPDTFRLLSLKIGDDYLQDVIKFSL